MLTVVILIQFSCFPHINTREIVFLVHKNTESPTCAILAKPYGRDAFRRQDAVRQRRQYSHSENDDDDDFHLMEFPSSDCS